MTNVQRLRVGSRGVIIGVNLLSVAIARVLQLAEVKIDRMVLPAHSEVTGDTTRPAAVLQSLLRRAHLGSWVPSPLIRAGSQWMRHAWMHKLGIARITPDGEPVSGSAQVIAADFVCISGGLSRCHRARYSHFLSSGHPIWTGCDGTNGCRSSFQTGSINKRNAKKGLSKKSVLTDFLEALFFLGKSTKNRLFL